MAPPPLANGYHEPEPKIVTVLVTGFGPFQDQYPVNPSFEIARSLPETLAPLSSGRHHHRQPVKVRIIAYATPLRVSYDDVRALVPVLLESYRGSIDMVLHLGMASGRRFYAIERYAHRDGYDRNADLDRRKLPVDDGAKRFPDCRPKMTTSLDFDDVFARWQAYVREPPVERLEDGEGAKPPKLPPPDVRMSYDAGHYLCDYVYFNSLAWFARRNGEVEGGCSAARPVLFLHVPPESDAEALEKGKAVTVALINAMADAWVADPGVEGAGLGKVGGSREACAC